MKKIIDSSAFAKKFGIHADAKALSDLCVAFVFENRCEYLFR